MVENFHWSLQYFSHQSRIAICNVSIFGFLSFLLILFIYKYLLIPRWLLCLWMFFLDSPEPSAKKLASWWICRHRGSRGPQLDLLDSSLLVNWHCTLVISYKAVTSGKYPEERSSSWTLKWSGFDLVQPEVSFCPTRSAPHCYYLLFVNFKLKAGLPYLPFWRISSSLETSPVLHFSTAIHPCHTTRLCTTALKHHQHRILLRVRFGSTTTYQSPTLQARLVFRDFMAAFS